MVLEEVVDLVFHISGEVSTSDCRNGLVAHYVPSEGGFLMDARQSAKTQDHLKLRGLGQ
jgi:hypothetical protein